MRVAAEMGSRFKAMFARKKKTIYRYESGCKKASLLFSERCIAERGGRQAKEGNDNGKTDDSEAILRYLLPLLPFLPVSFRENKTLPITVSRNR